MILIRSFSHLHSRKRDMQTSVEQLLTSCNTNCLCKWMNPVLLTAKDRLYTGKSGVFFLIKLFLILVTFFNLIRPNKHYEIKKLTWSELTMVSLSSIPRLYHTDNLNAFIEPPDYSTWQMLILSSPFLFCTSIHSPTSLLSVSKSFSAIFTAFFNLQPRQSVLSFFILSLTPWT